ncbi:MAG: hypothetical protein MRQ09_03070 [Candidatus Midichloria sp.]|nr:hypothetical protein [Candidatus Midichloria sp.]
MGQAGEAAPNVNAAFDLIKGTVKTVSYKKRVLLEICLQLEQPHVKLTTIVGLITIRAV